MMIPPLSVAKLMLISMYYFGLSYFIATSLLTEKVFVAFEVISDVNVFPE